jgi:VIT1/CCC1 family predicted Fe2+/Mn2+ transporter
MNGPAQRFVITDLRIPFFRLVLFFVKAALAAIPAAIIVGILMWLATAIIAGILGGGGFDFMMGRGRV